LTSGAADIARLRSSPVVRRRRIPFAWRPAASTLAIRLAGVAAVIGAWAAASTQFTAVQLPRPELVWSQLTQNLWSDGSLAFEGLHGGYLSNVGYTVVTALVAVLAGGIAGFVVGLCSARSQLLHNLSAPLLMLFAAVPPLVAGPFVLIWCGPGQLAQSLIVAFFAFAVIAISAQNAASSLRPTYEEMAATLGASPRQRLLRIVVPASLPAMIVAVRVCLATGWSLQAAGELLGSNNGVGRIIGLSQEIGNTAGSVAVIILLAVAGVLVETVLVGFLRYLTRWREVAHR
jgi:ABC-type nitrate/sulfonate/bicarbonate transport system permease component